MLYFKSLLSIAIKDLVAKKIRFVLTLIGVVTGVACLLFLLSLTLGINKHIRKELVGTIPVTELSVTPREEVRSGVLQDVSGLVLNDELMAELEQMQGVKTVYGIETLSAIPTTIQGWFLGGLFHFSTDAVVFGIPQELMINDLAEPERYAYSEKTKIQRIDVTGKNKEQRFSIYKKFIREYGIKHGTVPIVVSKFLLETYNLSYAGSGRGLARLSEEALIGQKMFLQFQTSDYLGFGSSQERLGLVCQVIGFSTRAPIMGIAVPSEYVNEWQTFCMGKPTEKLYRKFIIIASTPSDVDGVIGQLEKMGFSVKTSKETIDKINTATNYVGLGYAMNALLILFISSISITLVLMLSVNEEAVEIGILRSVGVRKSQVRIIYMLKAAFIGIIGGAEGIILGLIAIRACDKIALSLLKNQPYMPDTFFQVTFGLVLVCFGLGVVFSLLAGIVPANRAASLNPASVLRQG